MLEVGNHPKSEGHWRNFFGTPFAAFGECVLWHCMFSMDQSGPGGRRKAHSDEVFEESLMKRVLQRYRQG